MTISCKFVLNNFNYSNGFMTTFSHRVSTFADIALIMKIIKQEGIVSNGILIGDEYFYTLHIIDNNNIITVGQDQLSYDHLIRSVLPRDGLVLIKIEPNRNIPYNVDLESNRYRLSYDARVIIDNIRIVNNAIRNNNEMLSMLIGNLPPRMAGVIITNRSASLNPDVIRVILSQTIDGVLREERTTSVLTEQGFDSLLSYQFQDIASDEDRYNADICTICMDNFEDDDDVVLLVCKDCFHKDCAKTWLTKNSNTCPNCRTTIDGDVTVKVTNVEYEIPEDI